MPPAVEIVLTTFLLNVRHVLYGLSLGRTTRIDGWRRPAAAYVLTDEAFGVVVARQERSFGFLLGAELSMFVTWNLATLAGALLGSAIPDPQEIGVDLVFPLAFLALLVPLVRTRAELGRRRRRRGGRVGHGARAAGRHPDPRGRGRRQPAGCRAHPERPADTELRLDDAVREVA